MVFKGKFKKEILNLMKQFTITATVIGNYKYVKYQTEPYYCSQNINKLTPKSIIKKWNEEDCILFYGEVCKNLFLFMTDNKEDIN
jgi:hypothetical protein